MVIAVAGAVRRAGGGAVVEIAGSNGALGRGEASPLPGRSRETLDQSVLAIETILAKHPPIELELEGDAKESVTAALAPFVELDAVPSARFALETALFELLARTRGSSIAALLGGVSSMPIELNALVRLTEATRADALVARARTLVGEGFGTIKLKLPEARDAATFARARALVLDLRASIPEVALRLDVNGAWSPAEAVIRLAELRDLGLQYVEQPVAPADVAHLAGSPVPWAADESLEAEDADPVRLLATGPCVAFVIKPTCVGGLLRSRELGEIALSRGADVVITHALDGPIALAAARELASSFSRPPLACGLAPHPGLDRWAGHV